SDAASPRIARATGFMQIVRRVPTRPAVASIAHGLSTMVGNAMRLARATANGLSVSLHASPPPPPVDVDLGTLPAGKTVTIVFDVTVNGPHPFGTYSNQGTVTWTNSGSVLTDDPSAGGGADPTVTPGDRYNTSTAVVSSQNPSDFGAPVTFTATVTPTEGSGVTPD